jgi:SAM-dependent methyltransferase
MKDAKAVKEQYCNSANLSTRISIHEKYSVNKLGFGNWLYQQYEFKEKMRILELGCGTGELWTNRIEEFPSGTSLVMSDFSEGMVEVVRNKYASYQGVSCEQINIEAIPFEAESFDLVIANMMLYHVPNLHEGLSEVHRVLKKDGYLYCATFGENGIQKYLTHTLGKFGMHIDINGSFTLQNGAELLGKHFADVDRLDYIDALEVTETEDLLAYLDSMASIGNLGNATREELYRCFEEEKDEKGIILIPKEYGTFRCRKC